eukprot:scaffold5630_cov17-Tisochrysis_lutea.AAC.2
MLRTAVICSPTSSHACQTSNLSGVPYERRSGTVKDLDQENKCEHGLAEWTLSLQSRLYPNMIEQIVRVYKLKSQASVICKRRQGKDIRR